jgi:hypothetical protein
MIIVLSGRYPGLIETEFHPLTRKKIYSPTWNPIEIIQLRTTAGFDTQ